MESPKYLLDKYELQHFLMADIWFRHLLAANVDITGAYAEAKETIFKNKKGSLLCDEEQEYFDRFLDMHKYEDK